MRKKLDQRLDLQLHGNFERATELLKKFSEHSEEWLKHGVRKRGSERVILATKKNIPYIRKP